MIRLFKCYQCWYIFDDVVLYSGGHRRCQCGAEHFRQVAPTLRNKAFYVAFHGRRALRRIFWE